MLRLLCLISLAFSLLFNALPQVPSVLKAFLALLICTFTPLQIGSILIIKKDFKIKAFPLEYLITSWCLGVLVITTVSIAVAQLEGSITFELTSIVFYSITAISTFLICIDNSLDKVERLAFEKHKEVIVDLIIVFVLSLMPFVYFRLFSQYPYYVTIDGFIMSLKGKLLLRGELELTYFAAFISLISYSATLCNVELIELLWFTPIQLYAILSMSVYLLSLHLTGQKKLAFFTSVLCTWFAGGGMVCTPYTYLPKDLLYSFFPLTVYLINKLYSKSSRGIREATEVFIILILIYLTSCPTIYLSVLAKFEYTKLLMPLYYLTEPSVQRASARAYAQQAFSIIVASLIFFMIRLKKLNASRSSTAIALYVLSLTLYLIHRDMSLAQAIMLLIYLLILKNYSKRKHMLFLLYILVISALIPIISAKVFQLKTNTLVKKYIDTIEYFPGLIGKMLKGYYVFRERTLWRLFLNTYSVYGSLFYFIGICTYRKVLKRNTPLLASSAIFSLIVLLFFLLPYPFSFRMLTFLAPYISLFSSIALFRVFDILWKGEPFLLITLKSLKKPKLKCFIDLRAISIIAILIPTIFASYDNYINYLKINYSTKHGVSTFTEEDLKAAEYIKKEFSDKLLIISDPITIRIISGLTGYAFTVKGRVTIGTATYPTFIVMGGLFRRVIADFNEYSLNKLKRLYADYFNMSAEEIEVIIIVNNRTANWVLGSEKAELMRPFRRFVGLRKLLVNVNLIWNVSKYYLILEPKKG